MSMIIYGAGLSGIICANMLRRHQPVIYEAQSSLPNNHSALLRFRSEDVSSATSVPFQKVTVSKGIVYHNQYYDKSNIKFSNMYSQKVSGRISSRSIMNTDTSNRYISPSNFIDLASSSLNIEYNKTLNIETLESHCKNGDTIISTIPMPILMKIVGWESSIKFEYRSIVTLTCKISDPTVSCYQTLYYPDPQIPYYRVSITGNSLIAEFEESDYMEWKETSPETTNNLLISLLAKDFGIHATSIVDIKVKKQQYGKLIEADERERKKFMIHMTDKYNLYSLGRFATWKQIMLDEVVHDTQVIEKLMSKHPYDRHKHWNSK